jgi:Flp pilus assembly protein TadD
MPLGAPRKLWIATGIARCGVLAGAILLTSCTDSANRPAAESQLAPPERSAALSDKKPARQIDVTPLAAAHKAKPTDPAAALAYARALRDSGSAAQALAVLDKTSALRPADKQLMLERGLLSLDLGDPAKAEGLLRKAQDDKAPNWRLHSALGTALASRGKQPEAQAQFAKALELAPDHPSVLNNLALSYVLDGKTEEAERLLRKARQAKSQADPARLQQNLALVLGLRGKYEESRTAAGDALGSGKVQENVAYLQALTGTPAVTTQQAKSKPVPTVEPAPAPKVTASTFPNGSYPQSIYNLGGPKPPSE